MTALLERERELVELGNALSEAQRGRGRVVLIEAHAGLGKTSLLEAASQTATELGFTCLRARASELEREFAYGCVRQLLEPAVVKAPDDERDRLFDGAAALSKPLFVPTRSAHASALADISFSMRHGVYWLLNNLASERPLALSVDDLHWADAESLRFLSYLSPRLDGIPLAVLASMRGGREIATDLARLSADPETTVLRPEPLTIDATATLSKHWLGANVAQEFAAACHAATGGNPFFLEALLREAKERDFSTDARGAARVRRIGPTAVAREVLLRLSRAPAAATALVRAVAVLGDGASLAEAAALADLSEEEAAYAADLLIAHAILEPAAGLEFAHPIVRESVYTGIGSHERARAHADAARILMRRAASEERIAAQIMESQPNGEAERVDLLRRVAAAALARGAPAAAIAWLRRALAEPPAAAARAELLLELGSAELRLAMPEAMDHLSAAAEEIRQPRLLAIAVRQLANALNLSGHTDRAVAAIESAIPIIEPGDRELALRLEAELVAKAQQASFANRTLAARRLARYGNLQGVTPGERLVLASLAFEQARASESASVAAGHIEHALAGGGLLGEPEIDVVGPFYALVIGLLATDALDLARTRLDEALADARARASIPAVAFLMAHRGWCFLRQGEVAQAEADARTALELLGAHDILHGSRFALALLVEALIERGEVDAAERALTGSGLGYDIPPGLANNDLLEARGLLRLNRGDPRAALDDLLEFGRRDERWGGAHPLASRWRSRACFAANAIGDRERAHQMATEDLERARRWGAARGIGVALRAVALIEGLPASMDRLREAVDVLEQSPARLEHARALTDLGAALRRANQRAEARSTLRDGLDLAQRCNASALADRARTELRAAGGRSTNPAGTGLQRLTVSERRVAELAAQGHSNPVIAQTLFVTRKTIETHLSHIYSKLRIAGRAELVGALAARAPTAER